MIKRRLVYSYYDNENFNNLYEIHLTLLNMFIEQFNNIDFIIVSNNEQNFEYNKSIILKYINNTNINFISEKNNIKYREGIIYKKYVIDRLNEFEKNELVFFGHTKGVSGELDLANIENTIKWIALMYWGNLSRPYFVDYELIEKNNACFGTIYNYDDSSLTKYKWQYTGSFQWINPKRLIEIIDKYNPNNKNKELTDFNIKILAETFLGDNVPVDYVSFANHNFFNKKHSLLLYDNSNFPYINIAFLAYCLMTVDDVHEFINFLKINNLGDEITDDI